MSCYHPLVGINTGSFTKNGKPKYEIKSLKDCPDALKHVKEGASILIPCGKCRGCRLDYSRRWADRLMLQLETSKKAIFITLTYNDESLMKPRIIKEKILDKMYHYHYYDLIRDSNVDFRKRASVDVRDCQLFMKRLRKHFKNKKIKFFLSSEYGPTTERPHYHAIIFGIDRDDLADCIKYKFEKKKSKNSEWSYWTYISPTMEKIWSNGFVVITDVTWRSCAYVARYMMKKLKGDMSVVYDEKNTYPEFSLMSRRPGIGAEYMEQHPDCFEMSNIPIGENETGRKLMVPKYFLDKLALTDPEKHDKLCKERLEFSTDKQLQELQATTLCHPEYLQRKELKKMYETEILYHSDL